MPRVMNTGCPTHCVPARPRGFTSRLGADLGSQTLAASPRNHDGGVTGCVSTWTYGPDRDRLALRMLAGAAISVHSSARSRLAESVLDCAIRGDIASPARTPRSWPNPRCRAAGWWSRPAYVDERPVRFGVRGNEPAAQPPPSAAISEACSKQTPTCSISTHDLPRSCCARGWPELTVQCDPNG
jgi:hypothetical protein